MRNRVKEFLSACTFIMLFMCGVVLGLYLLNLAISMAVWISPIYGPAILTVLLFTGVVSALIAGPDGGGAGGAPY